MENSYSFQKSKNTQKSQNSNQYDIYDINNNSKIISHYETETGNGSIHSNESLSNIIDVINNNNLNLFYQDDSTNFKRNIDNLNLKFYLETEKILASANYNSNNLFLILFKQITLYIKEIERLNVIILGLKKDEQSEQKMASFIQKREMDFETKKNIINALRFSNDTLEKKINNLIVSENNLKQENLRLIQENQFYKNNNSSNTNINVNNISHTNDKGNSNHKCQKKNNKTDLYSKKKYMKNNPNYIIKKKKSNYYNNYKNDVSISNSKTSKLNKENNKVYKNNEGDEIDSKSIIISVKRDEHLLIKGHRRNYSDQIGVGVLNQDNINLNINNNYNNYNIYNNPNNYNNGTKKIVKNNNTIKINKNNIISFGVSTPKAKPIQIKNTQLSGSKITNNSKYNKNSKSIKNDNKEKKIFTKKKTDNISNKSKHTDFKTNNEKNNSLMKCSSLVFNKPTLSGQQYGNMMINITENNYDFLIDNELDDLSMMENVLNQIKDYIKTNINSNKASNQSSSNIKK